MLNQIQIMGILACPVCGHDLTEELKCNFCHRKYSSREGVYILIDKETSGMEWQWDRRILSQKYRKDIMESYRRMISPEIREAHEKWWDMTLPLISKLSGTIVDVATGLGLMLREVMKKVVHDSTVVATDIDPNVLLSTRREFERTGLEGAFYLATDVKHFALKEGVADYITSFAGLNNITETESTIAEIMRIMKPGARAVLMCSFVDEGTPTSELAEDYGFLAAYIRDDFMQLLENTEFSVISDKEASTVIWKENEMDIFPIDGDRVYYHTILIEK